MKYVRIGCALWALSLAAAGQKQVTEVRQKAEPRKSTGISRLASWFCSKLGIDPDMYGKISVPRGGASQMMGNRIVRADLTTQAETAIADCRGCWSLILMDPGTLAALKTDGIWMIPLDGSKPRMALNATDLRQILGPLRGNANALLVAVIGDEHSCELRLETIDIREGDRKREPSPFDCLTEVDLSNLRKPSSLRAGNYLTATEPSRFPSRILLTTVGGNGSELRLVRRFLLPDLDKAQDGISRFDPVWLTDDSIAYLQDREVSQ